MTIIFIYNANSGLRNVIKDVAHKILSPSTYPCSLCEITYDTFKENRIWKKYRETNSSDFIFYHKDEFEHKYPKLKFDYPIILKKENNQLTPLIESYDLNNLKSVNELIEKLKTFI